MKFKKILTSFCGFIIAINLAGCSQNSKLGNPLQEKYGADADYFLGLKAVQKKDSKTALRLFNNAISHGTKYVSRRSMEQKIKLGNIQQQIKDCKEYLKLYNDDAALLFACSIFFENKEYALLLEATNAIDVEKCPNELVRMRLLAMREKQDSRLNYLTYEWFTKRKISQDHLNFYSAFLALQIPEPHETIAPVSENFETVKTANNFNSPDFINSLLYIIRFRVTCANKNYSAAYDMISQVEAFCLTEKIIPLTKYIVADIGIVYYSISQKYIQNGNHFMDLSEMPESMDAGIKYYSLLYAGRIYDKAGAYPSKAKAAFEAAMKAAPTDADYDMALWFLLNSRLAISTEECVKTLNEYCSTWHDPYYFTDILDNLSLLLFTGVKWKSFPQIYKIIDGYADNATTSRFAYLTGELIDQKFLRGTEEEKAAAFEKAFSLNAGTDVYYRILAAKKLELSPKDIERAIFTPTTAVSASNDSDAERLLTGYADFGFSELIYPEWQYFYTLNNKIFGLETICYVSEFLKTCGNSFNNNYYRSLHMISKTANLDNSPLTKKAFELSYPKNFAKEISAAAKEFEVEEYDMLGLIRTESFFNPVVESSAGALGLSQLMEATFKEYAAKLKIENADITNPATNIRIGTYYYSTLVNNLDSGILALFAYNAGPKRVKRWLQTSKVGLGVYKNLPTHLFLETIPFPETRNYGRKVTQSAAIYAWLYYDKNPCDVIDEIM